MAAVPNFNFRHSTSPNQRIDFNVFVGHKTTSHYANVLQRFQTFTHTMLLRAVLFINHKQIKLSYRVAPTIQWRS